MHNTVVNFWYTIEHFIVLYSDSKQKNSLISPKMWWPSNEIVLLLPNEQKFIQFPNAWLFLVSKIWLDLIVLYPR